MGNKTTISNYTTKIPCWKTSGEIQGILAQHGAVSVTTEFDNGSPTAVSFSIMFNGRLLPFRLPTNPQATLKRLQEQDVPQKYQNEAHALNVAWRNVRQWLLAQLQFIAEGQVSFVQAMMPYAITDSGETLFDKISSGSTRLLGDGA